MPGLMKPNGTAAGATETMEFPSKVDFRTEVYRPLPETASVVGWDKVDAHAVANELLGQLSAALGAGDSRAIAGLFRASGCHWRDTLALTAHLRTFNDHASVTSAFHELHQQRGIRDIELRFAMPAGIDDKSKWITIDFAFKTKSPPALCNGLLMSVPEVVDGSVAWKIWSLGTWMADFEPCPEDEKLLREPTKPLPIDRNISTDVLIVGGGNSGLILGARLKALGVDFVIVEKHPQAGENWATRYDCMRFHVYKSSCQTPYLPYPDDASDLLKKKELSDHMLRFAKEFDLNKRVLYQSKPESTTYDEEKKVWTSKIACIDGGIQVSARFLVLAHGGGYSGKFIPDIPGADLYKGIIQHSVEFRDAEDLVNKGAKSAIIVGSANTAFDLMVNCHKAGLKTTMIQKSPTYVLPVTYGKHPLGYGVYDILPIEKADAIIHANPLAVGGPMFFHVNAMMAGAEPDRYKAVKDAGFLVQDATEGDILYQVLDRCGGHFMDMGSGMDLIATKKVAVKSGVVPVAYTPEGLEFSDGTSLAADAIVWCTGFGSGDGRKGIAEALGKGSEPIANKMEPLWGIDAEGEARGLYKRELYQDNVWVLAGGTMAQRFYSKIIALQIKGLLEGLLPEAYRKTPTA